MKHRPSVTFAMVASAILSGAIPTPTAAQDLASEIEEYILAFSAQRQFNGSALVAADGEIVFKGGFGYANMEWEVPNTPDTKFRIGSITKQFTAALILRLVEEGRLGLDAPVREVLPEYPQPQGDQITIHHLLNHTSGIPSYTNQPGFMEDGARDPLSPRGILELTWSEPLEFEPGSRFNYSNSGYVLLGWIIERVTGQPYDSALRERILDPLGLRDTGYDHESEVRQRGAFGYNRTLTGYHNARYIDTSLPHAAGMLYSTVEDLYRWNRALHGAEVFDDPESLILMTTPGLEEYGYGLGIRDRRIGDDGPEVRVVEHGGGIFGFTSFLRYFPDDGYTIVVLDNTSGSGGGLGDVLEGITRILYDMPAMPPRASIAERILPVIEAAGVEAGLQRYRERKRTHPDEYDFRPQQFFMLGEHFLQKGDTVTAIALLEANVEEHPDGPFPRFALAEVLAGAGDTARAAETLEAALTRRPGMPQLMEALSALGVEVDPVLRMPVVPQPLETLDRYVGSYEVEPGVLLSVRREGPQLLTKRGDEGEFRLLPQSETLFLLHGSKVRFAFDLATSGEAVSVTVVESGQRVTFPRLP